MIDMTLIGIGSGSPGHLTREGAAAMAVADLILIPEKSEKADLADLRRALVAEVLVTPPPLASFAMPQREAANGYRQGVEEWHDAIAAQWEGVIRAHAAMRPALLVWGDPSLYDSTLRIAARVGRRLPLRLRVIPGITAVQALCAAHAIPLNDVAQPVTITTGRQLRDHGWPVGADRMVVMLDGDCAFQTLDPQDVQIWWGAFLGLPQQMLMRGPLAQVGPQIIKARARARAAHGWIMDTYLLARCAPPLTLPPGPGGDTLARALGHLDVTVNRAELSAQDARPILMAMQAPGRATYVFHDLSRDDAADIAATVAAYLAAPAGWISDARPCGRLRLCLKTRIPAD